MDKTAEQLKEEGFTQDQIAEIEKGLESGIDVSIYAKKEFLAIQMRQIRFGIEQGLAVEKYARLEYDWFQMEEIRKGLLGGVDVERYASPEISYDRMKQIRWGLCAGIDLSPYKRLDAGILKELRMGVQSKVNIIPYITAGYDAEQLEVIRMALEKGLEIDPYLDKVFLGISMKEICEGLEHGVDVSIYAKPEYCWQQMREIRLGLEHMVEVWPYQNAYYSWQQMREIRLGLEEGLDVSYYQSFVYTAEEMQKRRTALQQNPAIAIIKKETPKLEKDFSKHYQIRISEDEMEAFVDITGNVSELHRTDLLKALRNMGVTYGILYEEIENIVSGNSFRKSIRIAKGMPARNGKDGWYEFFFRTQVARTPKKLDNGNVDYRTVEWFEQVEKGQKLAYYHSATQGENGISVTGKVVPFRRGKEQSILTGKGFRRLPDGRTYISERQGIVTIQDTHLEVSQILVMEEVNLVTGNVDFDGNVFIRGNVSNGTRIQVTGDLVVQGYVEASEIICGGNVLLKQGMNASGIGRIRAGKDVIGRFFEATEIYACGNIQGDYFLNCKMHAEGNVFVSGKKGRLAGGSVFAEKGLRTSNLGNQSGLITYVKLGLMERILQREKELDEEIRGVDEELAVLVNAHRDFQRKYAAEVRNTMEIYLQIESAVYTKEKQKDELFRKKAQLEEEKQKTCFVSAMIHQQLYEGVIIEIDGVKWVSKPVSNVMVMKKGDRIAVLSK